MKYESPLSPHPLLWNDPIPDEAEIRARIKYIQNKQQQEVITMIFQQARSNISCSPLIPTPRASPTAEPSRNASITLERSLHSRYSNHIKISNSKEGPPPPEPAPTYTPKDLSDMIANGNKRDAAYYIYEAVRGCQTKVKNASARETEFVVEGMKVDEGDGRMAAPPAPGLRRDVEGVKEEPKSVQRNTLDVARDPRLQRR